VYMNHETRQGRPKGPARKNVEPIVVDGDNVTKLENSTHVLNNGTRR
jgi:hypothetical protein